VTPSLPEDGAEAAEEILFNMIFGNGTGVHNSREVRKLTFTKYNPYYTFRGAHLNIIRVTDFLGEFDEEIESNLPCVEEEPEEGVRLLKKRDRKHGKKYYEQFKNHGKGSTSSSDDNDNESGSKSKSKSKSHTHSHSHSH